MALKEIDIVAKINDLTFSLKFYANQKEKENAEIIDYQLTNLIFFLDKIKNELFKQKQLQQEKE